MSSEWKTVLLGDLCTLTKGQSPTLKTKPGAYPLIVTGPEPLSSHDFQFDGEAVCIPMVSSTGHGHASLKRVHYANGKFAVANIIMACEVLDPWKCDTRYLHRYLQHFKDELIVSRMQGTANVSLSQKVLATIPVVLPPLLEQRRILDLVCALDDAIDAGLTKVTRAERTFRAMLSQSIQPKGDGVSLDLVAENLDTQRIPVSAIERDKRPGLVPYYGAAGQTGWIDQAIFDEPLVCLGEDGNGLLHWRERPIAYRIDGPAWVNNHAHVLRATGVSTNWLMLSLMHQDISRLLKDGTRPKLNKGILGQISIRVNDTDDDEALLMAFLEVIESQKATNEALKAVRIEVLSALLSGTHRIPKSYDELMGA